MSSMTQLYARVFIQILDSSIAENFNYRHVFEDLLKLCDHKTGVVDMTRDALSRRLNIPRDLLDKAIDFLESPDPQSRDSEFEGRRIERLDGHRDWGWVILNWDKYDAIRNAADNAFRVRHHREKKKAVEMELMSYAIPDNLNTERFKKLMDDFIVHRREMKKPMTHLAIEKTLSRLSKMGEINACAAIEESISNGWQGVFEPKSKPSQKTQESSRPTLSSEEAEARAAASR